MDRAPTSSGSSLRLRTFGHPFVEGCADAAAAGRRKSLAFLALLAAAHDTGLGREKIMAYLWPESPADRAAHSLRQLTHALRRDLRADDLFLGSGDLRLNPHVISSDLVDFDAAIARDDLERAVALHRAPFLDGFYLTGSLEFETWLEMERAQRARACREALEALAVAAGQRGDRASAVGCWERLVGADPLDSRAVIGLMEALSAAGDRAAALRLAETHQDRLREELGAARDPGVAATAERIRRRVADPSSPVSERSAAARQPAIPSIAVLPFLNMSPDPDDEYFSDGLAEELTNALGNVPGLRVASRTSAFSFKGKPTDVRHIGDVLNVRSVVEGSVRKVGDRLRITAQLVDATEGYHLWSHTYERKLADVFAVQDDLARAIVGALPLGPGGTVAARLVEPSTEVVEAYTLYLRARHHSATQTLPGFRRAISYFERAILEDPAYAPAHAGLAHSYAMLGFDEFGGMPPREAVPPARAAAAKALSLAPALPDGHLSQALIAMLYDWEWEAAAREFRRALELKADDVLNLHWYALFLSAMGRHAESLRVAARARGLEPLSVYVQVMAGRCYYFARRYEDAIQLLETALEMDPQRVSTHFALVRAYLGMGLQERALSAAAEALRLGGRTPLVLTLAGIVEARAGRRREARQWLEELRKTAEERYVPPSYFAAILLSLGELDEGFGQLEVAFRERSGYLPFLRVDPRWDAVRHDPRFISLLKRLKLD